MLTAIDLTHIHKSEVMMGKVFEQGLLYTRFIDRQPQEIFYPDEEDVESGYTSFHSVRVASLWNGVGEPYFSASTEYAHDREKTDGGWTITFSRASDRYLHRLFDLWEGGISISQWLDVLENEHSLKESELQRVKRLAAPYL
jgi:hypothetical protein